MCSYKVGLFSFLFSALFLTASTFASPTYWFKLDGLTNPTIASNEVSHIHFKAWKNDFGWLLVWKQTDVQNEQVKVNSDTLNCSRQIKGLYYNSQRGERLWPLDVDTAQTLGFSTQGLSLIGGLFTSCGTGSSTWALSDPYGVYGYIKHTYKGADYSLVAGVQYENNKVKSTSKLFPTLQRFDNKFPLWVLYDHNGGLWFVGCKVSDSASLEGLAAELSTKNLNTLFAINSGWYPVLSGSSAGPTALDCENIGLTLDQLLLLKIQGLIGLSTDVGSDASALLGNEQDAKTQYFSSVNLNNSTLINYAKRKAEELCRGKWSTSQTIPTNSNIICWEWKGLNWTITTSSLWDKTLIVKNGSITLNGKMTSSSKPLDIFIDGGKLLINQWSSDMLEFNNQGYPTTTASAVVAKGIFLKGNFIVNGIVGPQKANRVIIHGKFTSLNTYAEPTVNRLNQVKEIVGGEITAKHVDLTQVFSWRCSYGSGSDGTPCPISEYQYAPLVIINQNYSSSLVE